MDSSARPQSHTVEERESPPDWNADILKELERLLLELAYPNVDPCNASVFARTREELDIFLAVADEIEKGAGRLVAEYSQKRNSLLPVHRLPETIIVKILRLALAEEKYDWKGDRRTYLHRQKELRLVCSQWNTMVKTAPTLWSKVSCADVARLKTALRRSAEVPLDVVCTYGGCLTSKFHCKRFALEMSEVAGRWGTLDIKGLHWVDFLSLPAPELTSLQAKGSRKPSDPGEYTWSGTFLGGEARKLTEMVLTHFAIPWNACPAFPSLEKLEIKGVAEGPTVQQLVGMLSQCPQLKACSLTQMKVIPLPDAGAWSVPGDPVTCPSLKKFHLEKVRLDSVVQILNSLQLPATGRIKIIANNHESSLGPLLDFVRRKVPEIDPETDLGNTICIDLEDTPTVGLGFPKHLRKLQFILTDPKWKDEEQKWQDCGKMIERIRPAFNMEEIGVNLWTLGWQIKRGFKFVRDVFPNVLRLCTGSVSGTLSLLTKPQPPHFAERDTALEEDDALPQWLFPNLQDLHLYMSPNTTRLMELIEARRNNPDVKPITKLVVDNSTTPEDVREKLKEFVSDLRFRVTK